MEVVGAISSVVAVIQLADRVIELCKFYIESVKDAPHDLRLILVEISGLKAILETVKFLSLADGDTKSEAMQNLDHQDGPLVACERLVQDLENLFPDTYQPRDNHEPPAKRSKSERVAQLLTALAWPLKAGRAKKFLEEIQWQKNTITLALSAESRYVRARRAWKQS
jgi:hypothetical protein